MIGLFVLRSSLRLSAIGFLLSRLRIAAFTLALIPSFVSTLVAQEQLLPVFHFTRLTNAEGLASDKELMARVRNLIEQRRQLRKTFSAGVVLKPGSVTVDSIDNAFLRKALAVVEAHMSEETFTVEDLAGEVGMSRVQLHRKLTALTNQPARDFIRSLRLHRGMELLKQNAGTVSEIAYMVGFGKASTFTKWFQQEFDILPSSIRKNISPEE
jgi:AraC-like DNA-binding protein